MNRKLLAWLQEHTVTYGIPTLRDPSTPFYKKTMAWLFAKLIDRGHGHDVIMFDIPDKYDKVHYNVYEHSPNEFILDAVFYTKGKAVLKLWLTIHPWKKIHTYMKKDQITVPHGTELAKKSWNGYDYFEYPIMCSTEHADDSDRYVVMGRTKSIALTGDIIGDKSTVEVIATMEAMSTMFDAMLKMLGYC